MDLEYLDKEESGFFDLPIQETCNDNEHNPPTHIYIPHGKGYQHVCPKCHKVTKVIPQQFKF